MTKLRFVLASLVGSTVAVIALMLVAPTDSRAQNLDLKCVERTSGETIRSCTELLSREQSPTERSRALLGRGLAYADRRRNVEAIADFNEAIKLQPKFARALEARAKAYIATRLYAQAVGDLNGVIAAAPNVGRYYELRGLALMKQGSLQKAAQDLDKAISIAGSSNAYNVRAAVLLELKKFNDALADAGRAIDLDDKNDAARATMAEIYRRMGRLSDAQAEIEKVKDSVVLEVRSAKARIQKDQGQFKDALESFDYVISRGFDDQATLKERDELRAKLGIAVAPAPSSSETPAQTRPATNPAVAAAPPPPVVAPVAAPPAAVAPDATKVALVVGNSTYASVSRLANPTRDADAVARALRNAGFGIVDVSKDLSRAQFVAALNAFEDKAAGASVAVIYFAGHGIEFGGNNYLIPVDAQLKVDRDAPDEAIMLSRVMSTLDGAKGLRLVILDACRNNPFAAQMRRTIATRSVDRGLARVEPRRGVLVAYAARDGELALDGSGQNSPFADALSKRIAQPNLEVGKLFRLVRDDVLKSTGEKQEPFVYGSLGGDDYYLNQN